MNKSDVLSHFGGTVKTARALGISHAAVVKWGDVIPLGKACQIEIMTGGELKSGVVQVRKPERIAAAGCRCDSALSAEA